MLIAGLGLSARRAPGAAGVSSQVKSPSSKTPRRTRRPPPSCSVAVPPRPVARFLNRSFPSLSSSVPRCPNGSTS
jgi:hypothetical protein